MKFLAILHNTAAVYPSYGLDPRVFQTGIISMQSILVMRTNLHMKRTMKMNEIELDDLFMPMNSRSVSKYAF